MKCKSCGQEIVWLKTKNDKNIPVDADTYHGESLFDTTKHQAHFATCKDADRWRKKAEKKKPLF
jgi:hypothetical protein